MNIPVSISIREESFNLYWAALLVMCILLLTLAFQQLSFSYSWGYTLLSLSVLTLLIALGLFSMRKLSHPPLSAVLRVDDRTVEILRYVGVEIAGREKFDIHDIEELNVKNYHHDERAQALFDFSPNYIPLIRISCNASARPLVKFEDEIMTLRLEDIRDIADFFHHYLPSVKLGGRLHQILSMM